MKTRTLLFSPLVAVIATFLIATPDVFAGTTGDANVGFYDDILTQFKFAEIGWKTVITNAATWLFWTLVVISMVWTFGMMALRKADIGEFFAEFIRFTVFTGFFWWLLINGPYFAISILQSLSQLGAQAGGLSFRSAQAGITPSSIVDIGFKIFEQIIDNMSIWPNKFHLNLIAGLMGLGILIVLCLVGINMLLLLVSAWFLAYAGIFFLGFGGSRWTSEMAINYYRTVLALAAKILAMVLLISIGKTFIDQYYLTISSDISDSNLKSLGALLMACIVLLALVLRIPPLLAGIVTGASVASNGVGSVANLGTLAAAIGMASATAGSAMASGRAAAFGGTQALMSAFSKASESAASSTAADITSAFSAQSSSNSNSDLSGTPFAPQTGFSSPRNESRSESMGTTTKNQKADPNHSRQNTPSPSFNENNSSNLKGGG